jgi:hypothetical protein
VHVVAAAGAVGFLSVICLLLLLHEVQHQLLLGSWVTSCFALITAAAAARARILLYVSTLQQPVILPRMLTLSIISLAAKLLVWRRHPPVSYTSLLLCALPQLLPQLLLRQVLFMPAGSLMPLPPPHLQQAFFLTHRPCVLTIQASKRICCILSKLPGQICSYCT